MRLRGSFGDAGKDCRLELTRGADVELTLQLDNDDVVEGSQELDPKLRSIVHRCPPS